MSDEPRRRGHVGAPVVGAAVTGVLAYVVFALTTRALGSDAAAPVSVLWSYWTLAGLGASPEQALSTGNVPDSERTVTTLPDGSRLSTYTLTVGGSTVVEADRVVDGRYIGLTAWAPAGGGSAVLSVEQAGDIVAQLAPQTP